MNKYLILGIIILAISLFSGYKLMAQTNKEEKMDTQNKKILVAYYSYSGNTQKIANAIHEKVGGEIFEIKTEGSYPEEYRAMTQQAQKESINMTLFSLVRPTGGERLPRKSAVF